MPKILSFPAFHASICRRVHELTHTDAHGNEIAQSFGVVASLRLIFEDNGEYEFIITILYVIIDLYS